MKRRLFNRLYAALEWLLLLLDGHMPTQVRIKAVAKPATFIIPVQHVHGQRISRDRASMSHHCDIPPWHLLNGGSWYCPLCRTWRTYVPWKAPSPEATAPHFVPRVRGRHNGHLRYIGGVPVDSGKLVMPGRRAW